MKKYQGNSDGDMSVKIKDYQPGKDEFAGTMFSKTNEYIERKEKHMVKDAGKIRKQAYKGRYD